MIDDLYEILSLIEERESTLFEIERSIFTKRYNLSQKHFRILNNYSLTMIYSIWEGFIQQAFQLYIKYIDSLEINFNCLSKEIITFHMENTFKQLKEYPTKVPKKTLYFNQLENHFSKKVHKIYPFINTENNVGFEVLNKILVTFSLAPFPEHWDIYKYPEPNLKECLITFLKYRNSVSHGGDISSEVKVTQEIFSKYKQLVINLMYGVYYKMIDGIESKTYMCKDE